MKKKGIFLVIIIIILIATTIGYFIFTNNNKDKNQNIVKEDPTSNEITVDDLKAEYGATGDNDIYTIGEDIDGRKMIGVKPELEYNVALSGALSKNETPTFENLDNSLKDAPQGFGIWIIEDVREDFLGLVKIITNGNYYIDESGYLKCSQERNNRI